MRRRFGTFCMAIGAALVLAALSLFIYNRYEDARAAQASEELLADLRQIMGEAGDEGLYTDGMKTVEIDGYECIGSLAVPTLDLELPVLAQWSYPGLQAAPCRYSGSAQTGNLVIAGHNYTQHFGTLSKISIGDAVYFQDADGVLYTYEVVEIDVLDPTAVEAMTEGEYDLTLFTCTYDGQERITVRCERSGR